MSGSGRDRCKEQLGDDSARMWLCASASHVTSGHAVIPDVLALPMWFSREKGLPLAWAGPVLSAELVSEPKHTWGCLLEAHEVQAPWLLLSPYGVAVEQMRSLCPEEAHGLVGFGNVTGITWLFATPGLGGEGRDTVCSDGERTVSSGSGLAQ